MNKFTNKLLHLTLKMINLGPYHRFINGMKNTKVYQQKNLAQTLEILKNLELHRDKLSYIRSYEDFQSLPITSYEDYKIDIETFKVNPKHVFCSDLIRFQPTSGSTNKIKWIPYNQNLLDQFDHAASIWLGDLASLYPKILAGQHYWSMSWLPNNLRDEQQIDDSEMLSPLKRFFIKRIFAVPSEVMFTKTIEENLFATACFLIASQNLSFISVWSPTFLNSIIELIHHHKEQIINVLEKGKWPLDYKIDVKAPRNSKQASQLRLSVDFNKIWPNLALISCWDTAQSALYAEKLKVHFPQCDFQGKGLWATEAVVTLPIKNEYLLAYQSHFYEFQDLKTQSVYPAWELKEGMEVSPIITTSNGLLRYKLNDRLLVTGHLEQCPKLTFLGRINDTDLVGEKISYSIVENLFKKISTVLEPVSLIGVHAPIDEKHPYYILLVNNSDQTTETDADKILRESYHYNLARDLNQLGPVQIIASQEAHKIYEQLCLNKGMIKGNIKIDPLITIETDEYICDYK